MPRPTRCPTASIGPARMRRWRSPRGASSPSDPDATAGRLGGRQEPVPGRPLVLGQEAGDLGPQAIVVPAGARGARPRRSAGSIRSAASNSSSIRRQRSGVIRSPPRSWPPSQARASRQSLSTVTTETPSAAATSGTVIPPKYLRVMTCAWRSFQLGQPVEGLVDGDDVQPLLLEVVHHHVERDAPHGPRRAGRRPAAARGR